MRCLWYTIVNRSINFNQLCVTRVTHKSLQLINPWPSNSRSNWNLVMLVFEEGGKPENPEKNPRSKGENQQQTQPTYDAGSVNRTRDTLVGGERSHHCATIAPRTPAPLERERVMKPGKVLYCMFCWLHWGLTLNKTWQNTKRCLCVLIKLTNRSIAIM